MTDPAANIPAADPSGIPDLAETCPDLFQFDDEPVFTRSEDPEVDKELRLKGDKRFLRTPARRFYRDFRSNPDAYRHLKPLPGKGESLHGVISGRYALWELVPAVLELTKAKISDLHIATLSFSKQNAADLLALLDGGEIERVSIIISYYFKSTSPELYKLLIPQLRERQMKAIAIRNHCKMFLIQLDTGTNYVIESSANMRSAQNCEQFVMTCDPGLYAFHRQWMEDEILHGKELGAEDQKKTV